VLAFVISEKQVEQLFENEYALLPTPFLVSFFTSTLFSWCLPLLFSSFVCSGRQPLEISGRVVLQDRCPFCHVASGNKALKETKSLLLSSCTAEEGA